MKVLSKSVVYEHRLCFHGVTLPGAKCAAAGALRKRYLTAGMENGGKRVCLTLQRFKRCCYGGGERESKDPTPKQGLGAHLVISTGAAVKSKHLQRSGRQSIWARPPCDYLLQPVIKTAL